MKRTILIACLLIVGCGGQVDTVRREHPAIKQARQKMLADEQDGKQWTVWFLDYNMMSGGSQFSTKEDAIEFAKAVLAHEKFWTEAVVAYGHNEGWYEEYRDASVWFARDGATPYNQMQMRKKAKVEPVVDGPKPTTWRGVF